MENSLAQRQRNERFQEQKKKEISKKGNKEEEKKTILELIGNGEPFYRYISRCFPKGEIQGKVSRRDDPIDHDTQRGKKRGFKKSTQRK